MKSTVTVVGTLFTIIIMLGISVMREDVPNMQSQTSAINTIETTEINKPLFLAKDVDGFIVIYSYDDLNNPFITTDIDIRTLREADKEKLKLGFNLNSKEELTSFLEDFGT